MLYIIYIYEIYNILERLLYTAIILASLIYYNLGGQAVLSCIDSKSFLLQVKPNRKGQLE